MRENTIGRRMNGEKEKKIERKTREEREIKSEIARERKDK